MTTLNIDRKVPRWALPLQEKARYKGAKGGRSGGKSHFYAEQAVEEMVCDPSLRFVCIREVQRSLKFSAKSLVEDKIRSLGVESQFEVLTTEIRRRGGDGVMIFEGMQDHTADSLRSLEGFGRAWVEEAHTLSKRSLELLRPTIRAPGSELWFSWNPDQKSDPVDALFRELAEQEDEAHRLVHVNYTDNPFCPGEAREEAERMRRTDPDAYEHIWLGGYNLRSDAQVLAGKFVVDEFEPEDHWDGPYYGADWGFAVDPTAMGRCWIGDRTLYIEWEVRGVGWGIDVTDERFRHVPEARDHTIRADSSHPQTIAELERRGWRIVAAPKWSGSVEEGVNFLRSFDRIVIHPRCEGWIQDAKLWSYRTNRAGDVLPKLEKGHDHGPDWTRYALAPLIQKKPEPWIA